MTTVRPQHRSLAFRALSLMVRAPEFVVRLVAGRDPVVIDGRVLNRTVQFLLSIGSLFGTATLETSSVEAARRSLHLLARLAMPSRSAVHVTQRRVPGPAGEIPVRVYRRFETDELPPAIVYFHGGGWVTGDLDTHDGCCCLLADESGCVVVSVDYRLAPEHPFPGAVEDCAAAYRWVCDNAAELSLDAARIGVMGDSAGGNLAASLTHGAAELGIPVPYAQSLVYPAMFMTFDTESCASMGHDRWLNLKDMGWFRSKYVPDTSVWTNTLAAPGLADNLDAVPPTLVFAAGFDPLRDEATAYADSLRKAGVPVRYRCYDDQIHGFFGMGLIPEALAIAVEVCRMTGEVMRGANLSP